jgi:hypothetical protein
MRLRNGKASTFTRVIVSGVYFGNTILMGMRTFGMNRLTPVIVSGSNTFPCHGIHSEAIRRTTPSNCGCTDMANSRPGRKPSGSGSGAVPER